MKESMACAEKEAILKALRAARGNKLKASRMLGISRAGLYGKLKVHHLKGNESSSNGPGA